MKIAVVGAGIVGTSCAWFLAREGHDVLLFDPLPPGSGTSYGNAGILSFESCLPVGHPEVLRELPKLLLDRAGPLRIRLRYLPTLLPWLARFLIASRASRAVEIAGHLVALVSRAEEAHDLVIDRCRLAHLVQRVGWLKVARDETFFERATRMERDALEHFDMPYEILDRDALLGREPALSPQFRRALHLPRDRQLRDPFLYTQGIFRAFERLGGRWVQQEVTGFEAERGSLRALHTREDRFRCDAFVIAAGVFSGRLLRRLELRVPLEAERGYHVMLPYGEPPLRHPVYPLEERFLLAPMKRGIRLTTGVELASPTAPPEFAWVRRLARSVPGILPAVAARIESEWFGCRPSLPDSLPVIGRAPAFDNLYLAFGHHHLGLTLAPLTGRIIADLMAGRDPGIDLGPYRLLRPYR